MVLVVLAALVAGGVVAWHRVERSSASASSEGVPVDASLFAPGACETFAPTAGNRDTTVFLDAGHGGIDPGGVGTTESGASVEEADVSLPIELDAMALLRAQGFTVVVSRTGASTVVRLSPTEASGNLLTLQGSHDDVADRDVCANMAHADLLVGIYLDAGASASDAGSVTTYDADRPFSAANQRFATLLQRDVLAAMDARGWAIPDDGVEPDSGFGSFVGDASAGGIAGAAASYNHLLLLGPAQAGFFDTPSQMPGALIEPLYLTDPFEGSIAASANGQEVVAQGIARSVEQYFAAGSRSAG